MFGIVEEQPNEYVPDFFEKPPFGTQKRRETKDMYISYMYYIYIDCDIGDLYLS